MRHPYVPFTVLSLVLVLAGCEDPTGGAPVARVGEARPSEPAATEPAAPAADDHREVLPIDAAASSFGFTGAKVTGSHDGRFSDWSGTVRLDPASIANSAVEVTIQTASLEIEPPRLSTHLRSADFFDVARYPTSTFRSTRVVEAAGENDTTHEITGELSLHGQTRSITFPARVTVEGGEVRAQASFVIDRRQFGIVYPGMPDDLIRDEVVIRFDVRAPRGSDRS